MMAQPQWVTDLEAASLATIQRILDDVPPPCDHRYCHDQGYSLCFGVAAVEIDMREDNGQSRRSAVASVMASIWGPR